ncbi:hypothetical protein SBRCBS47491_008165 [Sporothrix bragantina]|uniref:Proteophosphoglycan 5 n=1 Tax=Sporothrix bragantina TaxID=671064 RepID=A0ABP0CJ56_9PEZI
MTEPAPTQGKQTPGRRKTAPGHRRPNRKNYASENDVAKADPSFQPDFAQRRINNNSNRNNAPTTPQKSQKGPAAGKSPANATQNTTGKTNNRNNNNNNKKQQGHNTDSPAGAKPRQRTPPQTTGPKPAGPASNAFAGATFHASPAPSSLPLPSFFTKTNSPGTPRARPASGLGQQPSPPASDTEVPSATTTIAANGPSTDGRNPLFPAGGAKIPPPRDESSPLDLFFRADRAEKERNRRASSANLYGAPVGPFSPPLQTQALEDNANSHTFPRDGPQQIHLQQQQQTARRPGPTLRTSSSGISAAELDGTPGQPMGPAFATPFHDRIRAARPTEARGSSGTGAPAGFRDLAAGSAPSPFARVPDGQQAPPPPSVDDRSEALKRFLFSKTGAAASSPSGNSPASAPTTPTRYPGPHGGAPQPSPYRGMPYQNMYTASPASGTPNNQAYTNNHGQANTMRSNGDNGGSSNISAMEDSLRQILKLDPSFGSGASSSGIHRQ